jgi:hypothetical protein
MDSLMMACLISASVFALFLFWPYVALSVSRRIERRTKRFMVVHIVSERG